MAARRVLLIGWDSADWNVASPLLDRGELPNLERLVFKGVMGNLTSAEPMVDPALWTSLATGRRPADHGVLGFAEVSADGSCVRPVTAASRRTPSIWETLSSAGLAAHVVGWPATQGEQIDRGSIVSDWFPAPTTGPGQPWPPAPVGTIFPERLAPALNDLRVSPEEIDADMIRLFVPRAAEVNQDADFRLHRLRVYLAQAFSIQAAATWLLENASWDFLAIRFGALGAICREFMPYHPPRLPGLPQRPFQIYSDVVNSAYRLHDLMLGRLMELAGVDATVVVLSQHGYRSDHRRPSFQPAKLGATRGWTRPQGIFAAAGRGLLEDELIHGAHLLDVAPTLLALYQLPIGADLPGKVLRQAFQQPPEVESLPRGEAQCAVSPRANGALDFSAEEAASVLAHCQSIDYIGPFIDPALRSPAAVALENHWTLARSLLASGDRSAALPLLEEVYRAWPERFEFGQALCDGQLAIGQTDAARDTMEASLEYLPARSVALLTRAKFAYGVGAYAEALQYVQQARDLGEAGIALHELWARTLLALRRWPEAEAVCRQVIAADPDVALAHLGLGESLLRQRRLRLASESALTAIGLNFELAPAHFVLGVAQWRLGNVDSAARALQTAVLLSPGTPLYHRLLSALYTHSGEPERAAEHMAISHRLFARQKRLRGASKNAANQPAGSAPSVVLDGTLVKQPATD